MSNKGAGGQQGSAGTVIIGKSTFSGKGTQELLGMPTPGAASGQLPPRYQPPPLPHHLAPKPSLGSALPPKSAPPLGLPLKAPPPNHFVGNTSFHAMATIGGNTTHHPHSTIHQQLGPQMRNGPMDEPGLPQVNHIGLPPQQHPPRAPVPLRFEEFIRPDMLSKYRPVPINNSVPNNNIGPPNLKLVSDPDSTRQISALKEANQRLADDNQELRDLCCFLDDDRQKGRKLAREWQRFGRYTASVMRQEVSAYQSKLRELDNKQQELIKDNLELKELCLYLDEERGGGSNSLSTSTYVCPACGVTTPAPLTIASTTSHARDSNHIRDDGEESSSSTNADEGSLQQEFGHTAQSTCPTIPRRSASHERLLNDNLARQRVTFNDQIMQYVRNLECRVKQLEEDKKNLTNKISQIATNTNDSSLVAAANTTDQNGCISGRPEAVVRALQVLEVREQLEREGRIALSNENTETRAPLQNMDDGEKALVREMCNVVWRKLEEGPPRR